MLQFLLLDTGNTDQILYCLRSSLVCLDEVFNTYMYICFSGLTKAAADLRTAYGGCVGKVRPHFDAIREAMRNTGLALCGQSPCESAEAEKCVSVYRTNTGATCR